MLQGQTIYSTTSLHKIGASSLGRTDANLFVADVWSSVNAVANISKVKETSAGLSHRMTHQAFALSTFNFSAVLPTRKLHFATSFQKFGDSDFNEQSVAFGLGKKIGIVRLGGSLNFYQIGGATIRRLHAMTFNLGVNTTLSEHVELSFHGQNILSEGYSVDELELSIPSIFRFGIAYKVDQFLQLNTMIEKESDQYLTSRSSVEYQLTDHFRIYTGITFPFLRIGLGSQLYYKRWLIDYAFQVHQVLGWTHAFSLCYSLRKS
ncbi:hypothetical protein [Flammeovirga sp. SJP92]|uniref:hypothetical protein n=1 Tax=Flammeovirga sp. SJP92 TaxID=1775430 RepID=UPI0007893110|nr:hypothetical protein [Flammeovirga sp. SJP92]KXX68240.1 hypothetical protein AVL50_20820 [Flammeovirga sp. SJP92]